MSDLGFAVFLVELAAGGVLANAGTGLLITGALGVTVVLGFAAAYWLAGVPEPAHGRPGPAQRAGTAVRRARDRAAAGWERRPVLPADDAATLAWVGELHHEQPPSWALPAPTAPLALPAPVTFVSSPPVLPASSPAGTGDGPAPVGAVTRPDVPGRAPATAHTPGPPPSPAREGSGAAPAGDTDESPWPHDTSWFTLSAIDAELMARGT